MRGYKKTEDKLPRHKGVWGYRAATSRPTGRGARVLLERGNEGGQAQDPEGVGRTRGEGVWVVVGSRTTPEHAARASKLNAKLT